MLPTGADELAAAALTAAAQAKHQDLRLHTACGDVLVRLPADTDPEALNWATVSDGTASDQAGPAVRPGDQPTVAWTVTVAPLDFDMRAAVSRWSASGWASSTENGRGSFPVHWRIAGPDRRIACYGGTGAKNVVMRAGQHITLGVDNPAEAGRWTQRLLRQVMVWSGRRAGMSLSHGAVICRDGTGLMIAGPSLAGKTDLAVRLAHRCRAVVVTLDRCLLAYRDGAWIVSALPFGLNVAEETLACVGVCAADMAHLRPAVKAKRYLDLTELRQLTSIGVTDRCRLAGILILRGPAEAGHLRTLEPAETRLVLSQELAYADPGFPTDWLGITAGDSPAAMLTEGSEAGLRGLVSNFPAGSAEQLDAVASWAARGIWREQAS